jgi:hypothetical protein
MGGLDQHNGGCVVHAFGELLSHTIGCLLLFYKFYCIIVSCLE